MMSDKNNVKDELNRKVLLLEVVISTFDFHDCKHCTWCIFFSAPDGSTEWQTGRKHDIGRSLGKLFQLLAQQKEQRWASTRGGTCLSVRGTKIRNNATTGWFTIDGVISWEPQECMADRTCSTSVKLWETLALPPVERPTSERDEMSECDATSSNASNHWSQIIPLVGPGLYHWF